MTDAEWHRRGTDDGLAECRVGRCKDGAESRGLEPRELGEHHLSDECTREDRQGHANPEEPDRQPELVAQHAKIDSRGVAEEHEHECELREHVNHPLVGMHAERR